MSGAIRFGAWWPLWLLLVVPAVWWVRQKTLVEMHPRQLRLSALVRSLVVVLLTLALTEPAIYRSGAWVSVVYLVDVSQSVSAPGIQSAIEWIQRANEAGRPDHARYIPFGANATALESLDELRTTRIATSPGDEGIDRRATNIERAIDAGLESFSPDHLKRLVLLSDGNENAGDARSALSRLEAQGVHVYSVPLQVRATGDAWAEAMLVPPDAAADEAFPLEIEVYSQRATAADVHVRSGPKTLGRRSVRLTPGLNRIAFETSVKDDAGPLTVEAEVTTPGDAFAENNTIRGSLVVAGAPKVLYIEGHPESARYLQSALRMEGFAVTLLPPEQVPDTAGDMDRYDLVVLSDVPRSRVTTRQMRAMASYVEDLGGGFILAGGENTFGADGYSGTDIERVLPVTFDAMKPRDSVAMVVVLDKSGSMGGAEIGFAKEATKAPLRTLRDTDSFGVIAFDSSYFWVVPLQSASNRTQMIGAISRIAAGGETDVFPALEAAYVQLATSPSPVKHVILMSDGHTAADDFQALVAKMARAKITVSTVALGASADNVLLGRIADWGNGRKYYLTDASRVPEVFTDETERATGATLHERSFTPVVKKRVQAFTGIDLAAAPPLRGYVATRSKRTAEVLLESSREDPLLARWQYGLGKTAAFTSDVKDRWAVDWLRWKGYSKFWSQLVRDTMRTRDNSDLDLLVARDGDRAKITIEAIQKDGRFRNKLESELRVIAPDQTIARVPVQQVGPGSYEAEARLNQQGSYVFHLITDGGTRSRALVYSYPDEYHFYPPNTELLRSLSAETNGRFEPEVRDVFETKDERAAAALQLWPFLTIAALVLYLADIFLRRVRLFEQGEAARR